jgi:error-prone DNA polymerase
MPPYVELHCHSYFSLLDGASSPEALVERAVALGYPALALTDHDGLYSAVRFWRAARERGIKPIIGAEITLAAGDHLTLLAENQGGYAHLCRVISAAQLAGEKGHPEFTLERVAERVAGLLCFSGCRKGAVASALLAKDEDQARQVAGRLLEIFGPDHFWIELQQHGLPTDTRLMSDLLDLAHWLGVNVVASNNVHYAERGGRQLHDVLTCIRHHTTLPEALGSGILHPNAERFLKSPQEMAALFAALPQALKETWRIAERCQLLLDFSAQRLPDFPVPPGHTADSYLRSLCAAGLRRKFGPAAAEALSQLEHELGIITRTGLAGFFLVVWDIVQFARKRGIRCQGRGSAAGSVVAYVLDISKVDPLRHNLLFERFLTEETHTMPDIDVDFAADRREEVIQYVYDRYGEAYTAMVCNFVTYRARSAVRDVAKALGFPPDVIDRTAKALDVRSTQAAAETLESTISKTIPRAYVSSLPWQTLTGLLRQIEGVPRHLSIHVGGMVVTAAPLVEIVPLERAALPGRVVAQWDKDSVEDAGLTKLDVLGLRILGMITEALDHIRAQHGTAPDLDDLPLDDPAVYAMLQQADTIGCFQVESRAQSQMLPKVQPRHFEDIVVEIAIIRPGPIQGNAVHPYLRRRQGLEPVCFVHPALEPILAETLGVIVFQEQVIRVASAIAGLTYGEADGLRKAIGRCRSKDELIKLGRRFVTRARANGVDEQIAAQTFEQLSAFSGFGFCKSHAASFALIAYQTLFLKAHYPAAFFISLLNHQPMGFYGPDVVIGDARRHDVPVLFPDVNRSQPACTLESNAGTTAIRLGLRFVHGLGGVWPERIVGRRGERPFADLHDFCRRTHLPKSLVENLIRAGAMTDLGHTRRVLLWQLGGLVYQEDGLDVEVPVEAVDLPPLSRAEKLSWEVDLLGLAPDDHVMQLYREWLAAHGVLTSQVLARQKAGEKVRVAGRVVVRQRPASAKGFVFLTLTKRLCN